MVTQRDIRISSKSVSVFDAYESEIIGFHKKAREGEYNIKVEDIEFGVAIGSGNFGTVYEGKCRDTTVAIKVISRSDNVTNINDFNRECSILNSLQHPNIILFLGSCTTEESFMLVTEYAQKGSLQKILTDEHVFLNFSRKMKMAKEIALGMNWLHKNNPPIIHLDLKPPNVLITNDWHIKIGDFGLSRLKQSGRKGIFGTPLYMAPEMFLNEEISEKADVYSYGILLSFLVTQKTPFHEVNYHSIEELKNFVLNGVRPSLTDAPPTLLNLINRLWVREPTKRPCFDELITNNNGQIFMDIIIEAGSHGNTKLNDMWKEFGKENVNFRTEFLMPFCQTFNILFTPEDLEQGTVDLKCLQSILRVGDDGILTYANFQRFIKFFSPFTSGNELLLKLRKLLSYDWFYGDISTDKANDKLDLCKSKTFLVRFGSEGDSYTISYKIKDKEKNLYVIQHKKVPQEDIPNIISIVNNVWKKKYKMKPPSHNTDRPYAPIFNPKEGYSHNYLLLSDNMEQKKKEKEFFNMGKELNYSLLPSKRVEFVN